MPRYPTEICPKCKKNHRRGKKEEGEHLPIQQTFYYEAHLSNQRNPNQYRWKTYSCIDCNMYVMFVEHHNEPKNIKKLDKIINSITIHLIKLNKNFKYG